MENLPNNREISDYQKTYPAESFGGKERVKGNRQGSLSRSITRRSGQNCKIKLQIYILQFCRQLAAAHVRCLFSDIPAQPADPAQVRSSRRRLRRAQGRPALRPRRPRWSAASARSPRAAPPGRRCTPSSRRLHKAAEFPIHGRLCIPEAAFFPPFCFFMCELAPALFLNICIFPA